MRKGQKKTNRFTVDGEIVTVEIVKRDGKVIHTLCDKDMWFGFLDQYTWFVNNCGYAMTNIWTESEQRYRIFGMHRIIHGTHLVKGYDEVVHHKNEIKLDNRISNIVKVPFRENVKSSASAKKDPLSGKFRCTIALPKTSKAIFLGSFDTEEERNKQYEAAKAIINTCTVEELKALRPPRAHRKDKGTKKKKAG